MLHGFRTSVHLHFHVVINCFFSFSAFLPATAEWFNPILYLLGTLHLLLSIMVVIDYFLINWPHFTLPQFFYTTWSVKSNTIHIVFFFADV